MEVFLMARPRSDKNITDTDFIKIVNESISIRQALISMGVIAAGGNYRIFKRRAERLGLDYSHFKGAGWAKGTRTKREPRTKTPLEELLVENYSGGVSTYNIKLRLFKNKLLEDKCSNCGIVDWRGEKLSLHLDHVNGVNNDNRIENLRILCPNCHSQTHTYAGKNKNKNGET
jgi:hypothetical protein